MTGLLTLFGISFFGALFCLFGKMYRNDFLLPKRVYIGEQVRERQARYMAQKINVWIYYKIQIGWHLLLGILRKFFTAAMVHDREVPKKALMKRGAASFFLKHVSQHKHTLREEK